MKPTALQKVLCLLLALSMFASVSGCSRKPGGESGSEAALEETSAGDASEDASSDESESGNSPRESEDSAAQGDGNGQTVQSQSVATTSSGSQSDKTTSLTRDQVMKSMPTQLKGTTLNFFWIIDYKTEYGSTISAFEKATGITVKTEIANKNQYELQFFARVSSGNSPDMVISYDNNYGMKQYLQPTSALSFNFNDTAWDTELMKAFTVNGKTYGFNVKGDPYQNRMLIVYNKSALKKVELEDPHQIWKKNPNDWTWDKLFSMCGQFLTANRNRDGYYGIAGLRESYPRSFGVSLFSYDSDSSKYVNNMKNPETVKRYETIIDNINKKYAVEDATGFALGQVLFVAMWSSSANKTDNAYSDLKSKGNLGFVPMPTDSTHQAVFEYVAYGVPVGAKNPEAAPYYVRYISDPKSYDMNSFYITDEAKEVMTAVNARSNTYWGNTYRYEIWSKLAAGTKDQVKSVLDSEYGTIQALVDDSNDALSKLK
ncbi:MAG: extracellular solute-binding protein [Oscillospiraceae bacterium]|jgi:ABC-type glycerol-3-phosphate transport system substrate-binding protein|nr:extracellular solute-binding protein [Oscillospiraceae bacterium]